MVVLIAVMLVAFFVTVIFSVDVAYMQLVNTQLRTATDAAAKAAVDTLTRTEDAATARQAAIDIAERNLVAGAPLQLSADDIEFGNAEVLSDGSSMNFTPNQFPLNAARIQGRKTEGSLSGSARLFFAGLLGRPRYETSLSATASRRDRDICLVVDRSGSMDGTKIEDLKSAVTVFLAALGETPQDEFVGLASYSTGATRDHDLTQDLGLIDNTMQDMLAAGFTNIGGGIDIGNSILSDGRDSNFVEKTIIVMTDGIHNTGTDPYAAAERCRNAGIVIHAITFGAGADQVRAQEVAELTGGTFHHAPTGDDLRDIYREIALTLETQLTE
jgi:uncharacterized protein YegL